MRAYISGKITGTTDYMTRFGKADLILKAKGFDVVNPVRICSSLPSDLTHDEYMSICIPLLTLCGTIYMLKGYQDSDGSMEELKYAQEHELDIIFEEGSGMEQICGNCKWHEHENIDDGWVCVNADSEYCTDWTDYDHSCEDWEERE